MNQHWKLLTIGQSIDNFKYFHYSKYSISLQDNICKPCSVPSNFYSILNLLFVDSQLIIKLLNEFGYFHFYRAYLFCIVLIFKQDCQSMPFIFLFLISFILTLIYQVLDIIPMLRQESKRNNDEVMFLSIKLYHQTPDKLVYGRIFIMAMVDSLICIMMIVLQDQLYKDIHLFVFLEATEKIRLTSILRNGQKYITSIIFLFYLIITFTLIVSQLNNNLRLLILDFINDNVFPNYVFSLSFLLFTL